MSCQYYHLSFWVRKCHDFLKTCGVDGVYLNEVDRVLRPGGFWILSGPPINWKKHFKGWERTKEDLNEEQTKIENVAKSLCWKKLVEKRDIAIWQKPKNHLDCKANCKVTRNRPFCQAQDPDKAWFVFHSFNLCLFAPKLCILHFFLTSPVFCFILPISSVLLPNYAFFIVWFIFYFSWLKCIRLSLNFSYHAKKNT